MSVPWLFETSGTAFLIFHLFCSVVSVACDKMMGSMF